MKSFTSRSFREMYASLPKEVQSQARRAYRLFRDNPSHPGSLSEPSGGTAHAVF